MTLQRLLLSPLLLAVVSMTLSSTAKAQAHTTVSIESEGWSIIGIEHSSGRIHPGPVRTGRLVLPLGEVSFELREPSGYTVEHRRTATISPGASLRFGRWSHGGERTAGHWVFGIGAVVAATFLLTGLGLSAGGSHVLAEGNAEASGPVLGIGAGVLLLTLVLGIPLAAWKDDVVLEVHHDEGGAATSVVRLQPGPGELGLALAVSL